VSDTDGHESLSVRKAIPHFLPCTVYCADRSTVRPSLSLLQVRRKASDIGSQRRTLGRAHSRMRYKASVMPTLIAEVTAAARLDEAATARPCVTGFNLRYTGSRNAREPRSETAKALGISHESSGSANGNRTRLSALKGR